MRIGPHRKWVNFFLDHADVLEKPPLGIRVGQLLGCGAIGCVFSIGRNRVLKITQSFDEAAMWDVIADGQRRDPEAMRGVAATFGRPFGVYMPTIENKLLYGIVRERIASVRQTDKLFNWLKPIAAPRYPYDARPHDALDEMVINLPMTALMAASIRHLYLTTNGTYLLGDIHTDNVGRRKGEKWLILRDPGQVETPHGGREFDRWQPPFTLELR